MIDELELLRPMNIDVQQWNKIKIARIQFNRIRTKINTTGK
jgi:hypothetical protein